MAERDFHSCAGQWVGRIRRYRKSAPISSAAPISKRTLFETARRQKISFTSIRPVHDEILNEDVIDGTKFILFLSAALVLAVMPGPGILYVLGRTLNGGRREGVTSALGTYFGGLVHAIAAAVGLSALLVASALAFQIVRYAGAAYLIYLGIMMIRTRHFSTQLEDRPSSGRHQSFLQGIVTEVLNPKTALFFLSFIPQFLLAERSL
jgi:hypothetical protein